MRRTFNESQIRAAGADGRTVEGYGIVWGSRNSYGEIFVPGCFDESLAAFGDAKPFPMLSQHDDPIGRWTEYRQDDTGLWLQGTISEVHEGQEVATLLNDRAINGLSIGFWSDQEVFVSAGETFSSNGFTSTQTKPTWYILKARLAECSIVTTPADDQARVVAIRHAGAGLAPETAEVVLPGLRTGADWDDLAYSMAVLMGARGGHDLRGLQEAERRALYQRLAHGYEQLERTPPAFAAAPNFTSTSWAHDEVDVYRDRCLGKAADALVNAAGATDRPLSDGTKERLRAAQDAITRVASPTEIPAVAGDTTAAELARICADLEALSRSITSQETSS